MVIYHQFVLKQIEALCDSVDDLVVRRDADEGFFGDNFVINFGCDLDFALPRFADMLVLLQLDGRHLLNGQVVHAFDLQVLPGLILRNLNSVRL